MAWSGVGSIRGPQGLKGDTGAKGDQGIQGPKGDKGDTGPAGPAASTQVVVLPINQLPATGAAGVLYVTY